MKVLVVDDSASARKIVTEMLHEIGIGTVKGAADGAEAIEILRVFPADIMLCDLHMTPLDGIELTRLLRNSKDSPNPYIPIVMLSGDATQTQLKNAVNAGAQAFMTKPVKMNALHRKLFAIFSRPLVYVKENRTLRPLLAPNSGDAVLDEAAAQAQADAQRRAKEDVARRPLTRRDLGFR
jgi:CheY-like chemotaxis protein